tara:strand:+ start:274 stop:750 length:477 start_codon:yes stop_codon:yes gene_type:complete
MKKLIIPAILLCFLFSCSTTENSSLGNMLAVMQVDEPIPGVCDNSNVIAILPFPGNGQIKAKAPLTDEEITQKLNTEVEYLKDKTNYDDKGMVSLIVNCKGEMVKCSMSNKTKSPELDQQIVDVFSIMVNWKAGTVNGRSVDTSVLYSFEIKNGVISL